MSQAGDLETDHRAVFDLESTVKDWDDDYYHPVAERHYDRAVPWMLDAMGVAPGDPVLDAGCGPGVHSIRAARHGARMTAVDISDTMLAHAGRRAAQAGVGDQIRFQKGNLVTLDMGEQLPFVFSWGVVIHIPEIDQTLDALCNAVVPGGSLALHILSKDALDFRLEMLVRKLMRKPLGNRENRALGIGNWYETNGETLWVMRFDIPALCQAMEARGFHLKARRGAEFSEFQRRIDGPLRAALLHFNNFAYRIGLPAGWFTTQMLVFEKSD